MIHALASPVHDHALGATMNSFQQDIDERSNLTGLNKLELLLFRLANDDGGAPSELYAINVFKIREIVAMPPVTGIAESHPHMLGVVRIRDEVIPVIDLPAVVGCSPTQPLKLLLITEFARTTQAFAVASVEEIVRLEWTSVLPADSSASGSLITSFAKIDEGRPEARLAQVLDVETILRMLHAGKGEPETPGAGADTIELAPERFLLAADDSASARMLVESSLRDLKLRYEMLASGKQLWDRLLEIEADAVKEGKGAQNKVALVLSDLEMPEMDGFTLTRKIKQDKRFASIPVIIHSSLSGAANEAHVQGVGADAYIAKFAAAELAALLKKFLSPAAP